MSCTIAPSRPCFSRPATALPRLGRQIQVMRIPAGSAATPTAAEASGGSQQQQAQSRPTVRTCRRCKQQFDPATNGPTSCRYHSALWTGGEISKAIGFCRQSDAPEHQLRSVVGRTGLIQFWDCCGAENEDAPGCQTSRHVTYDDPDD